MKTNKIIHFVYFETLLCSNDFFVRWQHYNRSANSDDNVTLQESKKGDTFTYIAEHRCNEDDFNFVYTKSSAKPLLKKQTEIRKIQLGGYSIIQQQHNGNAKEDEDKLFVFLTELNSDINAYNNIHTSAKLNIYKAYFENCSYAYILQYYIKHTEVVELRQSLQLFNTTRPVVYKEFKKQYN